MNKRHWIIFDGDVDPEWVENLNSLLDDNKLLTLPNGERLALPGNVRVMFEVQDLKYATLATVSRCGMIWFSEEVLTTKMIFQHYIAKLRKEPLDETERELLRSTGQAPESLHGLNVQKQCADVLAPYFISEETDDTMVVKAFHMASSRFHIMDYTRLRVFTSMMSLLNKGITNIIAYNSLHSDFPMPLDRICIHFCSFSFRKRRRRFLKENEQKCMQLTLFDLTKYITNRLIYAITWGFGGSMGLTDREVYSNELKSMVSNQVGSSLPDTSSSALLDYGVDVETGEWFLWKTKVPVVEIETHKVTSPDVVIPTVDTVRHEEVLHSWLAEHRPLLLCGPPGSGKTMTLFSTLTSFPDFDVVSLNFSSATTPSLILKTFEHHCEYKKTSKGVVLRPIAVGKWLVVFCDEINLPATDKYGTQRVITFLRQMTEQGGFWRVSDHTWVRRDHSDYRRFC